MRRRIIFVLVAAVVAALFPAVAAQAAPKCFGRRDTEPEKVINCET